MSELTEIVPILQGGGNLSLVICVYFLWKVERRLTALETSLAVFIKIVQEHKQ